MVEILQTGFYIVRSLATGDVVGRNLVEDVSYEPKGIYSQPPGVPMGPQTMFRIQRVTGNRYFMKLGGDRGRVVDIDGEVYAALFDDPLNQRWAIRRQTQHGEDVFTIETEDGYMGWQLRGRSPYTQVEVRPIMFDFVDFPFYQPNQLWIIEKVD